MRVTHNKNILKQHYLISVVRVLGFLSNIILSVLASIEMPLLMGFGQLTFLESYEWSQLMFFFLLKSFEKQNVMFSLFCHQFELFLNREIKKFIFLLRLKICV